MLLANIAKTVESPGWSYTNPFVVSFRLRYVTPDWWTSLGGVPSQKNDRAETIGIYVNGDKSYNEVLSFSALLTDQKSWYYDGLQFWVHLDHALNPFSASIQYAKLTSVSDRGVVYIGETEYLPGIQNVPSISKKEDSWGYQTMAFLQASLTLSTLDPSVAQILKDDVIGNPLSLLYVPQDKARKIQLQESDVSLLAEFFVEAISVSKSDVKLKLQDKRKLALKVPNTTLELTDYPYLGDSDDGKSIPLLYGHKRGVPGLPTNSKQPAITSATYRLCLVATSIAKVQIKIEDTWITTTDYTADLANGSITVNGARSEAGADPYECKVDLTGIANTYASDIIKDLYVRYLSESFIDEYFDTTTWAAEQVNLPRIGLYIAKPTDVFKVINQVQNAIFPGFRFDITPQGAKTIKADLDSRAIKYFIEPCDILDLSEIEVESTTENVYQSVTVEYDEDLESDSARTVTSSAYAEDVAIAYQVKNTEVIPLGISSKSTAEAMALALATKSRRPTKPYNLTLLGDKYFDLEIFDIIAVFFNRRSWADTWSGEFELEIPILKILEVKPNYQNRTVGIVGVLLDRTYTLPSAIIVRATEERSTRQTEENTLRGFE